MGREITSDERLDEGAFQERLRAESKLAMTWFRDKAFEAPETPSIGLEVEAWLVDRDGLPSPRNIEFLNILDDPLMVPELAAFNFEYNAPPAELEGSVFADMTARLSQVWKAASEAADSLQLTPLMTGIPTTLREPMLSLDTITESARYRLLNDRLFQLRGGAPLTIAIDGRERLDLVQDHLMIEAACTSLQVHLMLTQDNAAASYNASQIASAPLIAISSNSPFLYGRRLWEETRIPAFESAVNLPGYRQADGRRANRVSFGQNHLRSSMMELFLENLDGYPPFLPMVSDTPDDHLVHFNLHNGTIWRWTRPILYPGKGKTPHLRLENRVMPAGPTVIDIVANTAFCIGLILHLREEENLAERLPFEMARRNFYAGAKQGLGADLVWLDGEVINTQVLIRERLADAAEQALVKAGVAAMDAKGAIDIIRGRSRNGQTGAAWQRAHANCNGNDHQKLILDYLARQQEGAPVHRWTI